MSERSRFPALSPVAGWWLARAVLVLGFALVVKSYWSPYYGFTMFLEADTVTAASLPASLRDAPLYIHPGVGRYDGVYYAQIATSPGLRDPALADAVDDVGYRARRILLSAIAWILGGGDPVAAVQLYAWLNVICWFLLAGILGLVLPVGGGWRATLAWAGLLLASGVLASVRLALTDLAALTLLASALLLDERGRSKAAMLCLGLAGLARETALLGAGILWPEGQLTWRGLVKKCAPAGLAVLPLAGWWVYVYFAVGSSSAGSDNFALPLAGWLGKWRELWQLMDTEGNHLLLLGGGLDCFALTAQAAYLLIFRDGRSPWWRVGLLFVVLGVLLGPAVWDGLPGAYSRVLLPLTLAFNVVAVRRKAALGWLLVGNLSVFSGVYQLRPLPQPPHELPAHSTWSSRHLLETDPRWSVAEWNNKWRWAWCAGEGGLTFNVWPHRSTVKLELQVRGVTPRSLTVTHEGREVWRGPISDRPQWIVLPELPVTKGRVRLGLHSGTPPAGEGADNTARAISFACFGARLAE